MSFMSDADYHMGPLSTISLRGFAQRGGVCSGLSLPTNEATELNGATAPALIAWFAVFRGGHRCARRGVSERQMAYK
jgi:hypothetical protein